MKELEQKAEEYLKELGKKKIPFSITNAHNCIKQAYKDGYEQGQKEEHNKWCSNPTWVLQLEKENAELKVQIEKMKNCSNCKCFRLDETLCKKKHIQMAVESCSDWENK